MREQTEKCNKDCLTCTEPCSLDGQISLELPSEPKDRSDYHRKYYQRHLEEIRGKYNSKTKYLRYVTVRSTIRNLKKQIGEVNYNLVINAIEQIEKE